MVPNDAMQLDFLCSLGRYSTSPSYQAGASIAEYPWDHITIPTTLNTVDWQIHTLTTKRAVSVQLMTELQRRVTFSIHIFLGNLPTSIASIKTFLNLHRL